MLGSPQGCGTAFGSQLGQGHFPPTRPSSGQWRNGRQGSRTSEDPGADAGQPLEDLVGA